jgi:2-polyprenyl-3-methyl-5-hydroxy-6-metoxy-1,4-benzoquinol methylase
VTPAELSRMAESSGCSPRAVQGMAYLPWSNSWAWVPDCSVNYALHAVKH